MPQKNRADEPTGNPEAEQVVQRQENLSSDASVAKSRENRQQAYRQVDADLVESVPENGALSHWILASPILIFLAWIWVDIFAHYSPIPSYWIDVVLGLLVYFAIGVLPAGIAFFFLVTSLPRLFGHAGWDVQPLEPVSEAEMYTVRYRYQQRYRAQNSWRQMVLRAAQGWVYIEIATILVGGVAMIPIFFSVSEFGFGQR
jgi:hypothetical protein